MSVSTGIGMKDGSSMHGSRAALACFVGACVLALPAVASAGKLDDLRDRTGANSDPSDSDDADDDDCDLLPLLLGLCDDDDELDDPASEPDAVYTSPARHELPRTSSFFYLEYPYANWNPGILLRRRLPRDAELSSCVPEDHDCWARERVAACVDDFCYSSDSGATLSESALRTSRAQIFGDVGRDTDGLGRGTLGLFAETNQRFAFDARWTYWLERGDSLWIGDVNLGYGLLRLPSLQLTPELGVRALLGGGEAVGVNASLTGELYPIRPLVLRAEVDAGNLGKALFWEAQATLGVAILRLELYAGVARFRVDELSFDSAFAGLRAHL